MHRKKMGHEFLFKALLAIIIFLLFVINFPSTSFTPFFLS